MVRQVGADWLAANGYDCYSSALRGYGAEPDSQPEFESELRSAAAGPFEFFAVFADGELAGYAKCAIGENYAATSVLKVHPKHLRNHSAYALVSAILEKYAAGGQKRVTNGFRTITHATRVQEFLEQFGFRRIYCDLQIVYRPSARLAISLLYPMRGALDRMRAAAQISGLLAQEHLRRESSIPTSR